MTKEANSDELAAFVTSTLRAIAAGIAEAQTTKIASGHGTGVSAYAAPDQVEFDIAVSAKSSDAVEGGLKIAVFGIGARTDAKLGSESSTVSRIKFSVPTRFKRNSTETPDIRPSATAWNNK